MKPLNPKVDEVGVEIIKLVLKINNELKDKMLNTTGEYEKGVSLIGFRIGLDYFTGALTTLKSGNILSGTTLIRCGLENIADMYYIFCAGPKKQIYARKYVESIEKFRKVSSTVVGKDVGQIGSDKLMRQINKWTDASIDDRLKSTGSSLQAIYDLFSYYSHPNPAAMIFLTNQDLKAAQINLLKQANCINMLNAIMILINHSEIISVTSDEIAKLSKILGFPLLPLR